MSDNELDDIARSLEEEGFTIETLRSSLIFTHKSLRAFNQNFHKIEHILNNIGIRLRALEKQGESKWRVI